MTPPGDHQGQDVGGGERERRVRAGKNRQSRGERPKNNSSSPSVRSYLSEEVRLLRMGGSVLIRVSSWPFSNFTHQREHHPAAGIPDRGAAGIWRIFRDLLMEPRVIWAQWGEKKVKAQWYFWCYEYLKFMLQLAVRLHLLILYCCPCCYFLFCSRLGYFHNGNQQLSDTRFSVLSKNSNKIWFCCVNNEALVFIHSLLGLNHRALLNSMSYLFNVADE